VDCKSIQVGSTPARASSILKGLVDARPFPLVAAAHNPAPPGWRNWQTQRA
jgi:hypothetical protein